jgi:hypothetical protein
MVPKVRLCGQNVPFGVVDRPGIAAQNLNATRRAACVAAAAVEYVDTVIFDSEYQFTPRLGLKRHGPIGGLGSNRVHWNSLRKNLILTYFNRIWHIWCPKSNFNYLRHPDNGPALGGRLVVLVNYLFQK